MNSNIRVIKGISYKPFAIAPPGKTLCFIGGRRIAVETWALDWGQHEFNYEINSRPLDWDGRPLSVVATRDMLQDEFFERRVVSRLPIPISVGVSDGRPEVQLTLGEVSPQVYETQLPAAKVMWELNFRSHRLVAAAGPRPKSTARQVAQATIAGQSVPNGFDYLMVHAPLVDRHSFRIVSGDLGLRDVIGTDRGLSKRWWTWVTGR
ncbi:hypothetical protein [Achromobacter sp.]|uniref:hypothetical protein n=1 Tax=Achromobacter sp. TaxID=134375 RepID=UPI0028A5B33F|nr:hypothetical protein [Achromobacter sp.]